MNTSQLSKPAQVPGKTTDISSFVLAQKLVHLLLYLVKYHTTPKIPISSQEFHKIQTRVNAFFEFWRTSVLFFSTFTSEKREITRWALKGKGVTSQFYHRFDALLKQVIFDFESSFPSRKIQTINLFCPSTHLHWL